MEEHLHSDFSLNTCRKERTYDVQRDSGSGHNRCFEKVYNTDSVSAVLVAHLWRTRSIGSGVCRPFLASAPAVRTTFVCQLIVKTTPCYSHGAVRHPRLCPSCRSLVVWATGQAMDRAQAARRRHEHGLHLSFHLRSVRSRVSREYLTQHPGWIL